MKGKTYACEGKKTELAVTKKGKLVVVREKEES
ncbi:hypothetical protein G3A_16595 [Bacillus sp. 17376]|nr:hypothetical protein G3A_16595 [Bacillus sp. 17376]